MRKCKRCLCLEAEEEEVWERGGGGAIVEGGERRE